MSDFALQPEGNITLFRPQTDAARAWLAEHCPQDEAHFYWAGALVVEHRFVRDIAQAVLSEGFSLE